jgi:iron complex outermembrane receptor protein
VFGGYTTHRDYLDGYNNPVPNSRFNTGDVKSTFAYTGKKFTTSLKYNYLNEKYGLTEIEDEHDEDEHEGEEHEGEEHEEEHEYSNGRTLYLPYQNLQTHLLAWENTLLLNNNSKLKLDFGYIFNNRQEFEDEHHHHEHEGEEHEGEEHEGEEHEDEDEHEHGEEAALNMNLHTISYNLKWYSPRWNKWDLTTGSQGMVQTNTNHGEETLIPDALTFDIGAFAMTNFYYSEKAYLQAGIRLDNRHISTSDKAFEKNYIAVNFSAGIFQPLAKYLSLRTNISTGFRAPNMFELLSDGVHHGTNRYEIGDNELKTENSYQIDASLNFESTHIEAFISPYFNYVKNFIYLQPTSEIIDETPVYNYKQADAFLYGGEAGIHLHPHPLDWLHIECSYSNTFGQNIHHNWLPLMPSQKIKANLSVIFTNPKILKKYSFYVQNIYSLAQNFTFVESGYAEAETPDYYLLNIGANFEFLFGKQRLLLNFSVNNLLNEKYFDHLSRYKDQGIYNMGRSFVVKLSLPITASI